MVAISLAIASANGIPQQIALNGLMLDQLSRQTGVSAEKHLPDLLGALSSSTRVRQSALLRQILADPLQAPRRVAAVEADFRAALRSPARLIAQAGALYLDEPAVDLARPHDNDPLLQCASDPLVAAMASLSPRGTGARGVAFRLPAKELKTRLLRMAIARVLFAIARAERLRLTGLAGIPTKLTPAMVLRQSIGSEETLAGEPDYRRLLTTIDRKALVEGMQQLVNAVETLNDFLAVTTDLPAVLWQWDTPLGQVVIDTTGRGTERYLRSPLLIVDVGGDDTYVFETRDPRNRISVLLDRGGNDRYVAQAAAADPSVGVMGYGIVWDTDGDDRYEGTTLAQGAALFGVALHVDGGGEDLYSATGYAQGFAIGGVALLLSTGGNDRFLAQTHAQGAAGPEGVAVLLDTAGDEHYVLGNDPLLWPSSQLPDRNVSMGQGAGRGLRATRPGDVAATGGIGVLLDLAGDDHYVAQVFAQGVGYYEGVGVLVDGGGRDIFEAAWYAMGSAAHHAVGIMVNHGLEDDNYHASHSTSLGAAHDYSAAFFIDDGGNDQYTLGNLGLGASNDVGVAVFVDLGGKDLFTVGGSPCLAFGVARLSQSDAQRTGAPGLGLFIDSDEPTNRALCTGTPFRESQQNR